MPSDLEIATRAVKSGLLEQAQLDSCVAERRQQLNDGLGTSLRELLLDRGILDATRWQQLLREEAAPLAETRGDPSSIALPKPEPKQEILGGYRIVSELGRGAMGVVYEALQEGLDRRVALKVLPEISALQGVARERFQREAKATASLKHPGIVPIYDIGEDRGIQFFAMELLEGRSLKVVVEEDGPLPPREVARLGQRIAEALEFAHSSGVIHRDVKPDNVILRAGGEPVVTDFGLARLVTDRSLTREGVIVGTPLYMAPEQASADGSLADHRVDIYGLGITLYELLTGAVPFEAARDTAALLDMVVSDDPTPLATLATDLPAPLVAIVEVAMEKDPARRFATAGDLAADLGRFLEGEPILARPPSRMRRAIRRLRRNSRQLFALGSVLGLLLVAGAGLNQLSRTWQADALVLESHSLSQAGELDSARARLHEALELRPGLPEALFRLGTVALLGGESADVALESFNAALAGDPQHTDALLARGQILNAQGRHAEALADFEAARASASDGDPRPLLQGGLVLNALDQPEQATLWLQDGLALAREARIARDALYSDCICLLGELELRAGRAARALPELEEAVRLSPEDLRPRLLLTEALLARGSLEAAADAASMALVRDGSNLRAKELRGQALRLQGKFPLAAKDLKSALSRPSARLLLGLVHLESLDHQLGRRPKFFDRAGAKEHIEAVIEDPSLSDEEVALGRVALGWLSLLNTRPRKSPALREFDAAIARAPTSAQARLSRGLLLLRWKRYDDAEADLLTAQGLEGGAYGARVALGRLAKARGDNAAARRHLDAAIVSEPERTTAYADRYRVRLAEGDPKALDDWARGLTLKATPVPADLLFRLDGDPFALAERASEAGFGEFARALAPTPGPSVLERSGSWLRRSLVFDPLGLSASARMASVTYLMGRVTHAAESYARARLVDPSLIEADLMRAVVHRDLRDPKQGPKRAEELLRSALREAPPKPVLQGRLRYELALTLRAQGREDEALQTVDDALRFTPNRYCAASLRVSLLKSLGRPGVAESVRRTTTIFGNPHRDRIRGALYAFAGDRTRRVTNDILARHFFTRAIEADPRNAAAWRGRSKIAFRGTPEQIPSGLIDIFMAAELEPLYTSRFLEMESRLARFKHVMPLVREKVEWVTEHSPEVIGGLFVRGYLMFFEEDYKEAYLWFSKAFEASLEQSYFSLTYRGACLVRLGRLDAALEDLDLAESLFADGPVTAYWRACLYAKQGRDEEVLDALRGLAEIGYLYPNQLRDLHELRRFQTHPEVQRLIENAEPKRR